jgi:hypothetical protein
VPGLGAHRELDRRGVGVAAKVFSAEEAIRYALSQDTASLATGIDSMKVLEQPLGIARGFKKMSEDEQKALRDKVKEVAGDGRHECFKSTQFLDGLHHQKQHGLTRTDVEGCRLAACGFALSFRSPRPTNYGGASRSLPLALRLGPGERPAQGA